jgi:hypothetical protein
VIKRKQKPKKGHSANFFRWYFIILMQYFFGYIFLGKGEWHQAGAARKKVMQLFLQPNLTVKRVVDRKGSSSGQKIGLMGKIFGCWHKDLSRPFTENKSSYRVCTECGARREFDTKTFKTLGTFYYPPSVNVQP